MRSWHHTLNVECNTFSGISVVRVDRTVIVWHTGENAMKKLIGTMAICLLMAGFAFAGELKSGLPVGDRVPAFNVRDITGPSAGKTLCYRCQYGARPVVTVFTREVNDSVTDLVAKIDAVVGKNKDSKMAAFVCVITEDSDKVEKQLAGIAKDKSIKNTPLTIIEGKTGPDNYNLSKDAAVTVMMWNESKVVVNHAFEKATLESKEIEAIIADTKKILE